MADQAVTGNLKLSDSDSRSFDVSLIQIRRLNVGDKIRFPNVLHARFVALLSDVEKILGSGIAVGKVIRAVKQEVLAVDYIHHKRRISPCKKFDRRAPAIDHPVPGVKRRGEQAPRTPFECLLAAAVLPYFGGALSVQNANYFFIEMLFR